MLLRTIKLLCIVAVVSQPIHADEFLQNKLAAQCYTGNGRNIARFCMDHVTRTLDKAELTEETMDQLLEDRGLELTCYMAHFLARQVRGGTVVVDEFKNREFMNWLLSDPGTFRKLVFSGRSGKTCFHVLYRLWLEEECKPGKLSQNLMLGAALIAGDNPEPAIEQYRFYRESHRQGRLFPQFDSLEPWEYAMVLGNGRDIEDLLWGQEYLENKKFVTADKAGSAACRLIPYRMKNSKGVSIHDGSAFYDGKRQTLAILVEYGGVCGAVTTGACGFIASKGVPSYKISQPGHSAFVWKGTDGAWKIGNNIYGWVWSGRKGTIPWDGPVATILTFNRFLQTGKARESDLCYLLAEFSKKQTNKEKLLKYALKLNQYHVPAWEAYLEVRLKQASWPEREVLVKDAVRRLDDPYMADVLIRKFLDPYSAKTDGYLAFSMILDGKETRNSLDLYFRNVHALFERDIPGLKGKLAYNAKSRGKYFSNWLDYFRNNKTTRKERSQTCDALEKALAPILDRDDAGTKLVGLYRELIVIWQDRQLASRAHAFVKAHVDQAGSAEVRKQLARFGVDISRMADGNR